MTDQTAVMRKILLSTFPNSSIPNEFSNLKIGDLEEWDSLGNFNLLLAVEAEYSIRFSIEEMSSLKSISQIIDTIKHKI